MIRVFIEIYKQYMELIGQCEISEITLESKSSVHKKSETVQLTKSDSPIAGQE